MNINTGTLPKQAHALLDGQAKVRTYEATGGAVTSQFAAHNLTLIPPIPANSIIHDNMCGAGTVTKLILASSPTPPSIKIHATDNDPIFLSSLSLTATANSRSDIVEVSNQSSESLSFPSNTFTHSITNIGIFFTSSFGLAGAREIYRTLQPGGIAVANCWQDVAWFLPLKQTHDATRSNAPYPAPPIGWSDGKQIVEIMKEAGFKDEGMKVERSEAWAKTSDLRGWAEMSWAFLGGVGTWREGDEEGWDEAVDRLVRLLREKGEGDVKVVGKETWLRASQWVVIARK